jgi:Flp pilus assembly protein TadG
MITHLETGQRGSATAEFAVLIPAVCLVLVVCLSGLQLATRQLQIHDAAALAARSAGRGADPSALIGQLAPGASVHTSRRGNLVCVHVEVPGTPVARLFGFSTVDAESCAFAGGG